MSLGYYEDWSKAVLGRRRRVRARDWKAPRRWMDRTDQKLGACKAWILGGSAGDSADHPCIVFLTNRALYIDVRPYEGGTPGLIVAPFFEMPSISRDTGMAPPSGNWSSMQSERVRARGR